MKKSLILSAVLIFAITAHAQEKTVLKKMKKKHQYEEVDFEDMMRRYFLKESINELEGIYSVSCVITKKGKVFLSKREKVKVVERKDNYARVAVIKDIPGTKRDFIEISMSYRDAKKYPIMGEFSGLSTGTGLIYTHIEPDGTALSFSMISESPELLEGEFSKMERRRMITYKLSYIKIYPKNPSIVVNGQ